MNAYIKSDWIPVFYISRTKWEIVQNTGDGIKFYFWFSLMFNEYFHL